MLFEEVCDGTMVGVVSCVCVCVCVSSVFSCCACVSDCVQLYEYGTSFLHAKVAVVDGRWATVGSSNIDPLSLLLSREANVVIDDRRFAQELRERLIERIAAGAMPVSRPRWRKKPLGMRVRIWIAYGVARLLMGWFGYAGKHFGDV